VRELNALDRYLFLYLLTNGRALLTGIYELPLDLMASESGIDAKDLRLSMLQRLEPKVYYKEGWVIIKNYPNHRVSDSPKLITGINKSFNELPKKIQEIATLYGYPIHTIPIPNSVSRNRIEENRIAIPAKADLQIVEEDSPSKKKKSRARDKVALAVMYKCYDKIEREYGVRPTETFADYLRVLESLKSIKDKDIYTMVDDALVIGKAKTLREMLTAREVDIYRQQNV